MLTLASRRVVLDGGVAPAVIEILGERISAIRPLQAGADPSSDLDFGDLVVMPGLIDTHVHINDPGRTDWEGFESAGRAAAAGGITTLIDMPLNSDPVTTTVAALTAKRAAAKDRCRVDYGFWGGVAGGNTDHLDAVLDAGALGFKCFLVDSGIDEFPAVGDEELQAAMRIIARRRGGLLAHAEDPGVIERAREAGGLDRFPRSYTAWLRSRPPEAEVAAIQRLARLSRATGCRVHIVHVASGEAAYALREAQQQGLPMTGETCPHYLTLAAEDIPDGATHFKCAPPIRDRVHQARLWRALESGVLGMIVTDHSPCPPAMKLTTEGDFARAWGGIASLQLSLSIVWSAARPRGVPLERLSHWMSASPAALAGLSKHKGAIRVGYDADLVVWNPEATFTVRASELLHRHKLTPYEGMTLQGVIEKTILRGSVVYDRMNLATFGQSPIGRWLRSGQP